MKGKTFAKWRGRASIRPWSFPRVYSMSNQDRWLYFVSLDMLFNNVGLVLLYASIPLLIKYTHSFVKGFKKKFHLSMSAWKKKRSLMPSYVQECSDWPKQAECGVYVFSNIINGVVTLRVVQKNICRPLQHDCSALLLWACSCADGVAALMTPAGWLLVHWMQKNKENVICNLLGINEHILPQTWFQLHIFIYAIFT